MAKFILKSPGKPVEANGYVFEHGKATEVRDDDTATLRKLRGDRSSPGHPCFAEVLD